MSQLVLSSNIFYILEIAMPENKELSIHTEMDTAVSIIHAKIQEEVDADRLTLTRVTIEPKSLIASVIPFSQIAIALIKKVKQD